MENITLKQNKFKLDEQLRSMEKREGQNLQKITTLYQELLKLVEGVNKITGNQNVATSSSSFKNSDIGFSKINEEIRDCLNLLGKDKSVSKNLFTESTSKYSNNRWKWEWYQNYIPA